MPIPGGERRHVEHVDVDGARPAARGAAGRPPGRRRGAGLTPATATCSTLATCRSSSPVPDVEPGPRAVHGQVLDMPQLAPLTSSRSRAAVRPWATSSLWPRRSSSTSDVRTVPTCGTSRCAGAGCRANFAAEPGASGSAQRHVSAGAPQRRPRPPAHLHRHHRRSPPASPRPRTPTTPAGEVGRGL